ncbi:putative molybdenum carrier protein [Prosthecobacter sp.]|uniref:YpsA SLOG family protein n=1 Tax=Prosthecobacter sp. TaxID=1965333 RepID=UPI002ABBDF7A|nr:putative molybdenum carrier protein [Prosthecobacter sp.]MDZ4403495.1 putative molybdenum carrier protein [Prosthecobacter sp.]
MAFKLVILSGAQMGVERAALDWALKYELPHGGWCPQGVLSAAEPIDPRYKLKEGATDSLLEAITSNVRDAEATLVFTLATKAAGMAQKALSNAKKQKKPVLHVHRGILGVSEKIVAFIDKYYIRRLHITGSLDTDEAGVSDWAIGELEKAKGIMDRRPE